MLITLRLPPKENDFIPDDKRFQLLDPNLIFVAGSNRKGIRGSKKIN